jgi:hypothetical protein
VNDLPRPQIRRESPAVDIFPARLARNTSPVVFPADNAEALRVAIVWVTLVIFRGYFPTSFLILSFVLSCHFPREAKKITLKGHQGHPVSTQFWYP